MLQTSLDNGMRVLVDPRGEADVVALYLWINVGSVDEPAGLDGAAHVVEHMVFKGTRSFGVGEVAAAIEGVGGDLNAWTSFEETVFHATLPSAGVPLGLRVLAEMLRAARFDADELERERLVILEEIRGGEDDPALVLTEATWRLAFPDHAYGRPIIGSVASVAAAPRDALLAFYRKHYQPANCCLAVAGPVRAEEVLAVVRELFGGGPPAPARLLATATARTGHFQTIRRSFDTPLLEVAWPAPGLRHPAVAALDVLTSALGGGASAPLDARLRLGEELCFDVSLGLESQSQGGLATLFLHPRGGHASTALEAAREELARARAGGLARGEVERARAQLLSERVFGRETVDGRAGALTFYAERFGDPQAWRAYDAALLAVDHAEVTRAAQTWLAPERELAVALLPGRQGITLEPTRVPSPPAPRRPGVERITLDDGTRILLHPDDGEVAAVCATAFGGGLWETASTAGHGGAWARALARGAGRLGALDFPAAVERLAGGLSALSGRSSQLVRAEFVEGSFLAGLELFLDALVAPAFAPSEVDAVRRELLEAWEERDDHPEARLADQLWRLALGAHPWGLPPGGTRASLQRIRAGALQRAHRAWLAQPLVVAVAGAFDPDRVRRALTAALLRRPRGRVRPLPGAPSPDVGRRGTLRAGHEQAHVGMAWPGVAWRDPRSAAVEVVAAALGGQAGTLFRDLREERGLAYAVHATAQSGLVGGLVVAGLATDPHRAQEAEAALRAAVAAAPAGVGDDELHRARTYLLGGVAHDQQAASARAQALAYAELYGADALDYVGAARRRIERVTVEDARAAAAELLRSPAATVVVHPRAADTTTAEVASA